VLYRRDAVLVGRVFAADGALQYELPIPNRGSVWSGFVGKTTEPEALFTVQGVADPGTTYRLDIHTGVTTPFLKSELPYDPSPIVTEQVFYEARDGTRVPMYVVRRRDVALDGRAPLWIYGYGAQHWTAAPWFQPVVAAWLLDGGVWAVPNIRGGAEYGEAWYQAGARRNKQRGIDDYVAAVEWLIAHRYTSAGRVVAHTSSAGGVLVAAAVVQRPGLFGAAILEYPVLDMLRYEHLLTGNRWTEDYGTIADSADVRAMLGYSPIHTAKAGECYPPMLVTPGEFDQTAAPAHAYKFVAALQAAQSCAERPVLLRVTWGAGHTAGNTLPVATATWTDQLAFARLALGIRPARPHDNRP
jgi:prolyl oligopeptidase